MRNYYQVLGLARGANDEEIRRAYRALARKYHPDSGSDEEGRDDRFKEISEAYRALKDAYSRELYHEQYDRLLARRRNTSEFKRSDFNEALKRETETMSKLRAANDTRTGSEDAALNSGQRQSAATRPGFIETLKNQAGELSRPLKDRFFKSQGSNLDKQPATTITGNTADRISIFEVVISTVEAIQGTSRTVEVSDHSEIRSNSRKVLIRIPAGAADGTLLRLRSKEVPNEELVVLVHVQPMPSLAVTRKGIIIDLPISPAEALLGATIQVPTFDDPVLVKIPKGAQSGQELRLRGKGIKRGDTFGDLLLRLLIQNPHSPSDEESRKIANLSSDSVTRNRSELTSILKQFKQST